MSRLLILLHFVTNRIAPHRISPHRISPHRISPPQPIGGVFGLDGVVDSSPSALLPTSKYYPHRSSGLGTLKIRCNWPILNGGASELSLQSELSLHSELSMQSELSLQLELSLQCIPCHILHLVREYELSGFVPPVAYKACVCTISVAPF
jgi:hypothetical protein